LKNFSLTHFCSPTWPERSALSEAQRRAFGGNGFFSLFPPNGGVERSPRNAGSDPEGGVGMKRTSAPTTC
jgi:hypothetical protein